MIGKLTYTQAYVNPIENLGIPRSHFWRAMRQQHLRDVYTLPPEQLDLTTAITRMGENTRRTTNQIREMLENRSNQQRSSNFSQNRLSNRPFQGSSNNSPNFRSNTQNTNNSQRSLTYPNTSNTQHDNHTQQTRSSNNTYIHT